MSEVDENVYNISVLWKLLKLDNFIQNNTTVTIGCDLKMANILTGLMSHSSTYPCIWCNVKKEALEHPGTRSRSLKYNEDNYLRWARSGEDGKNRKYYFSCAHVPIIKPRNEEENILNIIPPPEFHLMLGTVNSIYKKMQRDFPQVCEKWVKYCAVEREAFHGGSFNGNSCRRLLSKVDYLRSVSPLACLKFVKCISPLDKLIKVALGKISIKLIYF